MAAGSELTQAASIRLLDELMQITLQLLEKELSLRLFR
jgi:hypothetical protein